MLVFVIMCVLNLAISLTTMLWAATYEQKFCPVVA
jgi:hypothetical protein